MNLVESLRAHRLLAIVRGKDAAAALRSVCTLAQEGIAAVEVSLTTADATDVIRQARAELGPDALLGAGTVRSAADAARAVDAGASYLVTPALVDGLEAYGVPVLMGALTPSEVETALARGAAAIKLFPASFGGPGYLKALRDPFPDVPFVPVGGVDAQAARDYLDRGAIAVGVGSPSSGTRPTAATWANSAPARPSSARWRRGDPVTAPTPPEVMTFGETMAALRAHGALRLGGSLGLSVAGAESNVAIGLARLGHRVNWAGRVGADELGALVLRTLRAEGVDTGHAATDDTGRPTGSVPDRTPPGHPDPRQLLPRRFGGFGGLPGRRTARAGPRHPRPAPDRHHTGAQRIGGRSRSGRRDERPRRRHHRMP